MIRYALNCVAGHEFEAWFRDSAAFDDQRAKGVLSCPVCASREVSKALMAPAVSQGAREIEPNSSPQPSSAPPASPPQGHALAADPRAKALAEAVRRLRRHVVENADYVGPRFAEEARRIHNDEAEHRDIYGEATAEETRALTEDGIDVQPLPRLPEEQN